MSLTRTVMLSTGERVLANADGTPRMFLTRAEVGRVAWTLRSRGRHAQLLQKGTQMFLECVSHG